MIDYECRYFDSIEDIGDICLLKQKVKDTLLNDEKYSILCEYLDVKCNKCENCGFKLDDGMAETVIIPTDKIIKETKDKALEDLNSKKMILENKIYQVAQLF